MPRSSTSRPQVETKALASSSKSEGMRMLYDAGYSVAKVKDIFGVPYGFAYGVALRHGVVATAATRRSTKVAAKPTKATAAKGKAKPATKPDKISATARVAARISAGRASRTSQQASKKAGRPTTARRQANRKSAAR